jgi:hypothetical protein
LIDWHKSIELDMIDDELLSSIPEELRRIPVREETRLRKMRSALEESTHGSELKKIAESTKQRNSL